MTIEEFHADMARIRKIDEEENFKEFKRLGRERYIALKTLEYIRRGFGRYAESEAIFQAGNVGKESF